VTLKRNSRAKSPVGTTRYYEECFEDLMGYVEKYAPKFKGGTSEDLREYLKANDRQGYLSRNFLDELEHTGKWEDMTAEAKPEAATPPKRSAAKVALSNAPPKVRERVSLAVKRGYVAFSRDGEFFIVEKGGRTRNARTGRFAKKQTGKTYAKEYPMG
jgi:hypothetical protein